MSGKSLRAGRAAACLLIVVGALMALAGSAFAADPSPPFNQCPAIGADTSCETLIYIRPDGTLVVLTDPSQPPYDNIEDTLVGVQNDSNATVNRISLTSTQPAFGFDGDGICSGSFSGTPSGCPFGPTGYEGPNTSFENISPDTTSGDVVFPDGLRPFSSTYFSLEEEVTSANTQTAPTITLSPGAAQNPVGGSHTVTATVASSQPQPGVPVSFSVLSGPNAGASGTCNPSDCKTDSNGNVTFTYSDANGAGTDTIQACFTDSGGTQRCATATKDWTNSGPGTEGPAGDPTCSDGIDNDGDGLVDQNDPGCQSGGGGGGGNNPCNGPGVIHGTPNNDTINGTPGDDIICAGAGDDVVNGRGGNDQIFGGTGNDQLNGNDGNDQINGGPGNDTIDGGAGADKLDGGYGDDRILGGTGNDSLNGGFGKDSMNGGTDDDRVVGGPGDDTAHGGGGNDVVIGNDGNDTLSGDNGNDRMSGGDGNDTMDGGAGDDDERGNPGDDTLSGDGGNDVLYGNADNDTINGGNGADFENAGPGNDSAFGGAGNDQLFAGTGVDRLFGQGDNDHLNTDDGAPQDTAACGGGTDKAVINNGDHPSACESVVVH